MAIYSLDQGLIALTSYGVIIIANTAFYNHIKGYFKDKKIEFILFIWSSLFFWGIIALMGVLGHIIINSQLVHERILFPIILALIMCIILPHMDLFARISQTRNVVGIVGALWAFMGLQFMSTQNPWWLLIHPLVLILLFFFRNKEAK